jgi:hypothetical protein
MVIASEREVAIGGPGSKEAGLCGRTDRRLIAYAATHPRVRLGVANANALGVSAAHVERLIAQSAQMLAQPIPSRAGRSPAAETMTHCHPELGPLVLSYLATSTLER